MGQTSKKEKKNATTSMSISKKSKSVRKSPSRGKNLPLEITEEELRSAVEIIPEKNDEGEKGKRGRKSYTTIVNEQKQLLAENMRLEQELKELKSSKVFVNC